MPELTLAIDTSTVVCAGLAEGTEVLAAHAIGDARSHAELLTGLIQRLLEEAGYTLSDVREIAVGVGPGPFTGLRVGIATARTLGWVGGVTPRGVCSLDIIGLQWASQAAPDADFVVATDARRKELYWASYHPSGHRLGSPQVSTPERLPDVVTIGPGANLFPQVAARVPDGAITELDAGFLATHAYQLPNVGLEPLYLRKPDAELPRTRKSALSGDRMNLGTPRGSLRIDQEGQR